MEIILQIFRLQFKSEIVKKSDKEISIANIGIDWKIENKKSVYLCFKRTKCYLTFSFYPKVKVKHGTF